MRAFQQGDRASFDRLCQAAWGRLCARAVKLGLGREEAEDIAQKALVRTYLYAAKARFDSERELWAWLYRIATREVYKHWRRKRPELISEEGLELLQNQPTAAQDDPAAVAAGSEAVADAGDCVARLAPDERLSLLGPLLHGLTFRAAAALHGLSLGQFKHRYETALERVRECMKRKGHDFP